MLDELTLTALLRSRASTGSDRLLYTFLAGGERPETCLSCGELDRRARSIGAWLRSVGAADAPVLLVFPAGPDFVAAFFGCLYAGAIAVPAPVPRLRSSGRARPRTGHEIEAISSDCGSRLALTTREVASRIGGGEASGSLRWVPIEEAQAEAGAWRETPPRADGVAYLQYTSGSTAAPRGVMVSHGNVIANCRDMARTWDLNPGSIVVSWLPHYHDFGLVFGLVQALCTDCRSYLMPPASFIQRPGRWLQAISRFRATHSGAPNFAYELCLRRIDDEQRAGLDLASWTVAVNGAEPVRWTTLERFAAAFEPCGFRSAAFCPGYGLAEATLRVTSAARGSGPTSLTVDVPALEAGRVEEARNGGGRILAGSGRTADGTEVAIVDPASSRPVTGDTVGEIWVAGPGVARGYWRRSGETASVFRARLDSDGNGDRRFLRTGDLGFLRRDELFVTGRLSDLVIVRGRNYSPDDLELVVEESHPALRPDSGVVFTFEEDGETRLVVVHEVDRSALRDLDPPAVLRAVREAVSEAFELEVAAIELLRPQTLPRTSSGKKRRNACRDRFLAGTLAVVAGGAGLVDEGETADPAADSAARADAAIAWLRDYARRRIDSRLIDERRSIPPYVVLDFGNHGILGLRAPARYGGLELGHRDFLRVLQQLAAIDPTLASFATVHNCLGIRPLMRYATAARREELVPVLARGRELGSFAMTEPGAGSNVRGISARGVADGAGWQLYGTKIWSGSAAWAGVIHTFVQLEGPAGEPRGITGFVLRQGSPGLRMGAEALTLGVRGMVQNAVHLEGVWVSEEDLLGGPGEGMVAAQDIMEYGRLCVGAMSVGIMKRCAHLMARYAGRRSIATGRLIDNPVTRLRLSELTAGVTAVESLVVLVAELLELGHQVPEELYCACKVAGPELAWQAADHLVQTLGGRGFIETNVAPQILRDTRLLRIFEGPTETMTMHLGSCLVHRPEVVGRFLSEVAGVPEVAADLEIAVEQVRGRSGASFGRHAVAQRRAHGLIGEMATFALLHAACRRALDREPSEALRRAEDWSRRSLERRRTEALGVTPAEAVMSDVEATLELIDGYVDSIGEIEQSRPGIEADLDPFLALDTSAGGRSPVGEEEASNRPPVEAAAAGNAGSGTGRSADEIAAWLVRWIAEKLGREAGAIQRSESFAALGFDSVTAISITSDLADWLGIDASASLTWDYPTIAALAGHLAAAAAAGGKG